MPRKNNLPFGFGEGEQYVTLALHRLRDKANASLNKQAKTVSGSNHREVG
jgi:hypothetical protein